MNAQAAAPMILRMSESCARGLFRDHVPRSRDEIKTGAAILVRTEARFLIWACSPGEDRRFRRREAHR